jgi:hypothetical protein
MQKQSWWDFKKNWDNFVSGLYQVNIDNLRQNGWTFCRPVNVFRCHGNEYQYLVEFVSIRNLGFQGFGMKVTITNVKEIGVPLNSFIPKYKIGWLLIERDVNLGFFKLKKRNSWVYRKTHRMGKWYDANSWLG